VKCAADLLALHWESNLLASLKQFLAVIGRYKLILSGFYYVYPRWRIWESLGYHAEIGPAVQVVSEKWPEILIRKPLLWI
jgi:hypothetical protein